MSRSPRDERLLLDLAALVAFAAFVVRIRLFLGERSFFNDEAALGLNVVLRSWSSLLQPLDIYQTAAPGYLWLSKAVTWLPIDLDAALRLSSFVTSMAFVPAIGWLGWRLLGAPGACTAVALAAFSPIHVAWSNEFKPYALDALAALTVLVAALHASARRLDPRAITLHALASLVALLFSQSVIFTVVATSGTLGLQALATRRDVMARFAGTQVLWGLPFGAMYLLLYSDDVLRAYMDWFHGGGYPAYDLAGLRLAASEMVRGMVTVHLAPLTTLPGSSLAALALTSAGALSLLRRVDPWRAGLVVAPLAVHGAAYIAHAYPVAGRLTLGLLPSVILTAAAGVALLVHALPVRWRNPAAALLGVFIAVGGGRSLAAAPVLQPQADRYRTFVEELVADADSLPVYVAPRGSAVFAYYAITGHHVTRETADSLMRLVSPGGPSFENAPPLSVNHEGARLATSVMDFAGRRWVLGRAAGIPFSLRGFPDADPLPWARDEVERLRAVAEDRAWVLVHKSTVPDAVGLRAAIAESGGRIAEERASGKDALWLVDWTTEY